MEEQLPRLILACALVIAGGQTANTAPKQSTELHCVLSCALDVSVISFSRYLNFFF